MMGGQTTLLQYEFKTLAEIGGTSASDVHAFVVSDLGFDASSTYVMVAFGSEGLSPFRATVPIIDLALPVAITLGVTASGDTNTTLNVNVSQTVSFVRASGDVESPVGDARDIVGYRLVVANANGDEPTAFVARWKRWGSGGEPVCSLQPGSHGPNQVQHPNR